MSKELSEIEQTTFEKAAYAMLEAHKAQPRMIDAINLIDDNKDFEGVPYNVLQGMWMAVNAYVDVNT